MGAIEYRVSKSSLLLIMRNSKFVEEAAESLKILYFMIKIIKLSVAFLISPKCQKTYLGHLELNNKQCKKG